MLVAWMVVGLVAKSVVLRADDLADHSDVWWAVWKVALKVVKMAALKV